MTQYSPDRFVLVRIELPEETFHKVLGTWVGGYLSGDSWQLNSGIESLNVDDDGVISFIGASGSVYKCHKETYGTSAYTAGILARLLERAEITLLTEEEMLTYLEDN